MPHPAEDSFVWACLSSCPAGYCPPRSAGSHSVRLEALARSEWVSFAREDGPAWWDEVVAVLRRHGHRPPPPAPVVPLIAEVKLAAVAHGGSFALAPASWGQTLPESVQWRPLAGTPLVRCTWSVWSAASTRRDLADLVAAFEVGAG